MSTDETNAVGEAREAEAANHSTEDNPATEVATAPTNQPEESVASAPAADEPREEREEDERRTSM